LGEHPPGNIAATPGGAAAPPSGGTRNSLQVELTDREAAILILVVLQAEGEVPLGGLAEELGLSGRQFGMGLGLLILDGKAMIRHSPEGFVVRLVGAASDTAGAGHDNRR
jgi:hypothetical protein